MTEGANVVHRWQCQLSKCPVSAILLKKGKKKKRLKNTKTTSARTN